MKAEPIRTPHFTFDGRGPSLARWIRDSDVLFPGTHWPDSPDGIEGAQYGLSDVAAGGPGPWDTVQIEDPESLDQGWVVFHVLQVIQIVPEEVHSYWHLELASGERKGAGVWEILDSSWLKGFRRHVATSRHFILEFYDHLVEVLADDLIFGPGRFSIDEVIDADPRFSYAFLRRAQCREQAGEVAAAIADYRKYASVAPREGDAEYARRCADHLEGRAL